MTIRANILQSSIRQRNRKILKTIVRIWTVTIPIRQASKRLEKDFGVAILTLILPRVKSNGSRR
jgi:hypothetical protein